GGADVRDPAAQRFDEGDAHSQATRRIGEAVVVDTGILTDTVVLNETVGHLSHDRTSGHQATTEDRGVLANRSPVEAERCLAGDSRRAATRRDHRPRDRLGENAAADEPSIVFDDAAIDLYDRRASVG